MSKKNRFVALLILLAVVLPFGSSLVSLFTDWLFFNETGYRAVFLTNLGAKGVAAGGFGLLFLLVTLTNMHFANRIQFPLRGVFPLGGNLYRLKNDEAAKLVAPLSVLASVLLAVLAGKWGSFQWQNLLLFSNAVTVGTPDPVLRMDLGFYLFQLPLLEQLRDFAGALFLANFALTAAVYYLRGGITLGVRGVGIDAKVQRHLGLLALLFSLVLAAGFALGGFRLLISGHSSFQAAGYTDVNARLLTFRVLTWLTPLAGVACAAGIWKGKWRFCLAPAAFIFLLFVAGIGVFPGMLQKFKVAPNELDLETPYLANHIEFTRLAYGLDKIETIPFDVDQKLSAADIATNQATIKNIRLWDHAPLLKTYGQLQQIRTYYKFFDVDNDRYQVNGQLTQVMLSPRELSYGDLPSRNWINEHLIFTHGNGLAMGPVSRISKEGLPEFFVKDIPPVSLADIKITRPEIYYGELSNDYVIVGTKVPEFSYPTATGNSNTVYRGKGGVPIDSLATKLLFAVRFGSEKILLSSDITAQSRILYNRNVAERVRKLAPFLAYDSDPYLVVNQSGGLTWMIDAYTHSDRMPYSRPLKDGTNYLRNSVKVTVDAYDGSITLYVSDPNEVLAKVYGRIYPGMFRPLSAMPEDLRRHIRYPHQYLGLQAAVFAAFHMTDPKVFYNKENLWEIPTLGEKPMEPYYTVMKLPGESREEYILLLPFTPSKRDNLAAWLTARNDGANYGKILAYTFPRDRLIYGPKQIDARINQDAFISQQLTLWNQRGSEVIRGSMLVIPIEKSLLYVQPLFLTADKGGLPELRRVIVAYGDQVVMEDTLELALQRIFGGKAESAALQPAGTPPGTAGSLPPLAGGGAGLGKEALALFQKALTLQRQGDWSGYGEQLRKLEDVLKRMAR
ncbi:UPF0182 protein [Geomonas limicola]|uniref:UPF0182 protein GMLC_33440 n=1 Tax=Geomonas limicola TaxID=2740186 RepID=A0A6V8NAX1_9BACT|nr:UPF0182 family protein [Geomonas limicola]GFO69765.1 UPF0182 protein [Geomonas limicola]